MLILIVRQTCLENSAASEKIDDKSRKVYYNARAWKAQSGQDAEVRAFLKFLATRKAESKLTGEIMEAVLQARRNEPWRKEFVHARELRERGRKEGYEEGYEEGLAIAQAQLEKERERIEELEARIAELERRQN